MIEAARQRLPDVEFGSGDIADWTTPDRFDVILANASLQWVPDHHRLLPALAEKLAPGGSLAVQMPDNLDEPAHRLMREVAAHGSWAGKLAKAADARAPRHDPHWYYELLSPLVERVDLWRTIYFHVLEGGAASIVEWFKSTGLRPFLSPLAPEERAEFLMRYEAAVAEAYPAAADGAVLLPFPRLFFVATR